MKSFSSNPRRLFIVLGAALAGVALFAGGALVAGALDDDDSGDAPAPANTDIARSGSSGGTLTIGTAPAIGRPPSTGAGSSASGEGAAAARMSYPGYGCNVPIPGVLKDGKVDPSLAGFAAKYLGAGFDLTGFTIRGQSSECNGGHPSPKVTIVVDTQWKHQETGLALFVSQAQDDKAMAAVLEETTARFSKDGYLFHVNVDGYGVQPLAGDGRIVEDKPLLPGPDARAKEVLRAALTDLDAPAEACFYVARAGSWDDVFAAGIGDPRGAISSGFTLQDLYVQAWTAPPASCGNTPNDVGINFNATWVYEGNEREFGALFVGASAVDPGMDKYPGYVSEYGANWNNGKFQFNVGYKIDPSQGAGLGSLEAIARLLDPNFANACVMREQRVSEAEMAALGIKAPHASGYARTATALVTTKLSGDCTSYALDGGIEPQTRAHWQLRNGAAIIEVNAYAFDGSVAPGSEKGWISDNNISWTSGSVGYIVTGWSEGGDAPSRDTLIGVARSMDPSFDPSTLSEQPGGSVAGSPPVKPAIAEDQRR